MKPNYFTAKTLIATVCAMAAWVTIPTALAIDDVDSCVALHDRQPVEIALSAENGYANCFTIAEPLNHQELHITSMSEASFMHQISVYELDRNEVPTLLGIYDTDDASLAQMNVPTNGQNVAFQVVPEDTASGKALKVQYLQMGTLPHVVIEVRNQ